MCFLPKVFLKWQPSYQQADATNINTGDSDAVLDRFETTQSVSKPAQNTLEPTRGLFWPFTRTQRKTLGLKSMWPTTSLNAGRKDGKPLRGKDVQRLFKEQRSRFQPVKSPFSLLLSNEILQDITPEGFFEKWYMVQIDARTYVARARNKHGQKLLWYYLIETGEQQDV